MKNGHKKNFLLTIFIDFSMNSSMNRIEYCIWQWCTTCGCGRIRDDLFFACIQELGIKFEDTGMKKGFCSIRYIRGRELRGKIIKLLCQKLSDLESIDIRRMLGALPFYLEDRNRDDFLKFIIMEIWSALDIGIVERDEVLRNLQSMVRNPEINWIITNMNDRYERNVLAIAR